MADAQKDASRITPEGRAFVEGVKAERARVLHALLHSIPVTHDGYASIEDLEAAIRDLPPEAPRDRAPRNYVEQRALLDDSLRDIPPGVTQ